MASSDSDQENPEFPSSREGQRSPSHEESVNSMSLNDGVRDNPAQQEPRSDVAAEKIKDEHLLEESKDEGIRLVLWSKEGRDLSSDSTHEASESIVDGDIETKESKAPKSSPPNPPPLEDIEPFDVLLNLYADTIRLQKCIRRLMDSIGDYFHDTHAKLEKLRLRCRRCDCNNAPLTKLEKVNYDPKARHDGFGAEKSEN